MGCSEKMAKRNVSISVAFVVVSVALVSVVVVLANESDNSKIIKASTSSWTWECNTETELCEKLEYNLSSTLPQLSFETCRVACGRTGRLWPEPTGFTNLTTLVARVSPSKFTLRVDSPPSSQVETYVTSAYEVFKTRVGLLAGSKPVDDSYVGLEVVVKVVSNSLGLGYDTDESYSLAVTIGNEAQPVASITAATFYGARHGLETLFQLIAYDDFCGCYAVVSEAKVVDRPAYKHRGISMDTSRNYFPMADLKRIVDGMSMNKLNILHWHITDTHSFPFVSKRRPVMSVEGAYAPELVYTMEEIKEFVEYARIRGVKIVPELDAPAHCGNGWLWGERQGLGELVWCANQEPWYEWCVEPPCGQLNPLNDNVFDILEDIYSDWAELFDNDIVHLGGDELSKQCWDNQPSIQAWMAENATDVPDEDDARLIHLWWHAFEKRAEERLAKAYGSDSTKVVLWTSGLTQHAEKYLSPNKHIVQVWTEFNNSEIGNLVKKGFSLIMSNYDSLYLDCGFQSWVGDGLNWCSPYKGWQQIHDNDPKKIIGDLVGADFADLDKVALGAEVALWTEQADPANLDSRLWPRSAAHAERLWTRPSGKRGNQVAWRLQAHRQRMVQMGIKADAMVPEWCVQNEGKCFLASGKILETDTGGI